MAQVPYDARFSDANQDTTRYVIKRNGSQAEYAPDKIRHAIIQANTDEMREDERLTDDQILLAEQAIRYEYHRAVFLYIQPLLEILRLVISQTG